MEIKFVPAPANLVAVFEKEDVAHSHAHISCPVVALTQTEFGQLSAMCAVPENDYFVPIDEVQPHLHRIYGGLYKFLHYANGSSTQTEPKLATATTT